MTAAKKTRKEIRSSGVRVWQTMHQTNFQFLPLINRTACKGQWSEANFVTKVVSKDWPLCLVWDDNKKWYYSFRAGKWMEEEEQDPGEIIVFCVDMRSPAHSLDHANFANYSRFAVPFDINLLAIQYRSGHRYFILYAHLITSAYSFHGVNKSSPSGSPFALCMRLIDNPIGGIPALKATDKYL